MKIVQREMWTVIGTFYNDSGVESDLTLNIIAKNLIDAEWAWEQAGRKTTYLPFGKVKGIRTGGTVYIVEDSDD